MRLALNILDFINIIEKIGEEPYEAVAKAHYLSGKFAGVKVGRVLATIDVQISGTKKIVINSSCKLDENDFPANVEALSATKVVL